MIKLLVKLNLVLMMIWSLSSCAISSDEMELLDKSTHSYERAIRWGEFARAKSFHKSSPTLPDFERRRMKNYRVTEYSVLQNDTPNTYNSYVLVEIKYYKSDLPVIKTLTVKQHWKRDKDSELWYLDSKFPTFK